METLDENAAGALAVGIGSGALAAGAAGVVVAGAGAAATDAAAVHSGADEGLEASAVRAVAWGFQHGFVAGRADRAHRPQSHGRTRAAASAALVGGRGLAVTARPLSGWPAVARPGTAAAVARHERALVALVTDVRACISALQRDRARLSAAAAGTYRTLAVLVAAAAQRPVGAVDLGSADRAAGDAEVLRGPPARTAQRGSVGKPACGVAQFAALEACFDHSVVAAVAGIAQAVVVAAGRDAGVGSAAAVTGCPLLACHARTADPAAVMQARQGADAAASGARRTHHHPVIANVQQVDQIDHHSRAGAVPRGQRRRPGDQMLIQLSQP